MITKKITKFKKTYENKENKVFGMPFLPLAIFLLLVLILLVIPPKDLTGRITDMISFSQTDYGPGEYLQGNVFIQMQEGDLIPETTDVVFSVKSNGSSLYEFTLPLKAVIAISETPNSGNYTSGNYINNGNPLPGDGYGFSSCAMPAPPIVEPPMSGEAISQPGQQPPVQLPDLTVVEIYSVDLGGGLGISSTPGQGIQPVKKLYTKIKNIGEATAFDTFFVEGYWINNGASEKFFEQEIPGLGAGNEIILDIGNYYLEGKIVKVVVDSTDSVAESNENNNEKTVSFGAASVCTDDDHGDPFVYGVCHDSSQLPFVKADYCIDEKTLFEYYCPGVSGMCEGQQITCQNGCIMSEGRCKEQGPSPTCTDTDRGNRPYVFGTCTDTYGSYNDECMPTIPGGQESVAEYYCTGNNLIKWDICSECSSVSCSYVGTRSEGWYAKCSGSERLIIYKKCSNREKFAPVCLYQGSDSEGWYTPDVCDLTYSACNYGCKEGQCKISNYSCDNWNNIYQIKLSKLNIKAPQERGTYNFTVELIYNPGTMPTTFLLASAVETFNVASHRACIGVNNCSWAAGSGPDQCSVDSECRGSGGGGSGGGGGGTCIESWQYTPWSECIAGQRTRECYDARRCGTTYLKPTYCLPSGTKFIQTESCVPGCEESWQCSEWSYCNQETQEQSAVCEDINRCNPMNYSYVQLRDCCAEQWDCKWGPCINGKQEKICIDINNCGTEFTKPRTETRPCKGMAWYVYAIIAVAAVVIILAILYATKAIKFARPKVQETAEEEARFTEVKI